MQYDLKLQKAINHCEELLSMVNGKEVKITLTEGDYKIDVELIKYLIVSTFKLDWRVIIGPHKEELQVLARQCFAYLCSIYIPKMSDKQIANHILRERTTIISNKKVIKDYIASNDELVKKYLFPIINHLEEPIKLKINE